MERESGVGFQFFVEDEVDFGVFTTAAGAYGGDLGAVEEAVGYDVVDLTRFLRGGRGRDEWPDRR